MHPPNNLVLCLQAWLQREIWYTIQHKVPNPCTRDVAQYKQGGML